MKLSSHLTSIIVSVCAISLYSQIDTTYEDSLCAYTWNSDINDCPDVLECIDPAQWNDTIIDLPLNITHISREGLKLCLEDLEVQGSAEIIYIMDLSSSMNPGFDPNAGDPYKKRPEALQAGFQFQIDSATNSLAGYIGFHSALQADQLLKPVAVNHPSGIALLNQMVQTLQDWVDAMEYNSSGYGSNYNIALEEAINYFNDTTIIHDSSKAIIFMSDGSPTSGSDEFNPQPSQIAFLRNNNIPVHGIFFTDSIGLTLKNLIDTTYGKCWIVPPTSTDTLACVVKDIVKSTVKPFQPKGITTINKTTNSSASAVSFQGIADTAWAAIMNKPIALKPGLNEVQLNVIFGVADSSAPDTTIAFKFYMDVGGDTTYTSECFYCWYRTQLQALINTVLIDTLLSISDQYTVRLNHYGKDTLDQVKLVTGTAQKGDLDTITIDTWTFDGVKFTFEKSVPFLATTGSAIPGNGTTESDFSDIVSLYWQHPEEVIDTAFEDIIVIPATSAKNHYLSLNQQQIKFIKQKKHQRNMIEILFSHPINYVEASLVSPMGRELSHCKGSNTRHLTLDFGNAAKGIYFLKLTSGTEKLIHKIVLSH